MKIKNRRQDAQEIALFEAILSAVSFGFSRASGTWNRSYDLSLPARRSAVIKISLTYDLGQDLRSFTALPVVMPDYSVFKQILLLVVFCLWSERLDRLMLWRLYDSHHTDLAPAALSFDVALFVLEACHFVSAVGTVPLKDLPFTIRSHPSSSPCKANRCHTAAFVKKSGRLLIS